MAARDWGALLLAVNDGGELRYVGKTGDYLVVEDEAGLVALAQMSILEIHTWNSHADTLEAPDRVIFDLDPAEDLPWKRVVEGALLVRKTLEELGLRPDFTVTNVPARLRKLRQDLWKGYEAVRQRLPKG